MQQSTSERSPLRDRVISALENHSTSKLHFGKNIWDELELVSVQVRTSDGPDRAWRDSVEDGTKRDAADGTNGTGTTAPDKGKRKRLDARVVVETVVQQEWLNPVGVLHGAATAYLVDVCTSLPLIALSTSDFWPGLGGLSASMSIVYHAACPKGARIRIDSTTMNVGKSIANMRCEIRDAQTSRLYASGTHTKVDAFATRDMARRKDEERAGRSADAGGEVGAGGGDVEVKAKL